MTVVGDVAQTGAPWGPGSWAQALDPQAAGRWRVEELTINYRTPAEIMAVAADVLASIGTGLEPPRSAREGGAAPWRLRADPGELASLLRKGADKARHVASATLTRAYDAIGFLPA